MCMYVCMVYTTNKINVVLLDKSEIYNNVYIQLYVCL